MIKHIRRFLQNRSGASAVEYGLLVALIAVTVSTGMGMLGSSVSAALAKPVSALNGPASSGSAPVVGGDTPGGAAPADPVLPADPVSPGKKGPGTIKPLPVSPIL
jgi:pilus assembly protein Flp/PilA